MRIPISEEPHPKDIELKPVLYNVSLSKYYTESIISYKLMFLYF